MLDSDMSRGWEQAPGPSERWVRLRARRIGHRLGLIAVLLLLAGPAASHAATCEGDECQSPPPAPEDPMPGTAVVSGPPNPPIKFPESSPHRHHHKKRHGAPVKG